MLDVGCGTGCSAVTLALCLRARVTAIDIHQPYLDELSATAMLFCISKLVTPRKMSMANMKFKPGTFDLIWAEGSAYFLGIRRSLETWLPLLNDEGQIAFTELCWLPGRRPVEAVKYFAQAYPEMTTSAAHRATMRAVGYTGCQSWVLPETDWWDEYLTPLEARMKKLSTEAKQDKGLAGLILESRQAIDLYRRYPDRIGYVFHTARKAP